MPPPKKRLTRADISKDLEKRIKKQERELKLNTRAVKAQLAPLMALGATIMNVSKTLSDNVKVNVQLGTLQEGMSGRMNQFGKELSLLGLSYKEAAHLQVEAGLGGIRAREINTAVVFKQLGFMKQLNVNTAGLIKTIAFNTQALGDTTEDTVDFVNTLASAAAQFQVSIDDLIQAVNKLRSAQIQTAAAFGPQVARAMRDSIPVLAGAFGAGMGPEITTAMNQLFAGTPEAMLRLARLGISMQDVQQATDPMDFVEMFTRAITRSGEIGGAFQGDAFAMKGFQTAFDIGPEFLVLAEHLTSIGGTLEGLKEITAEMQAEMVFRNDLQAVIATYQNAFTQTMLPIQQATTWLASVLGSAAPKIIGVLSSLLIQFVAFFGVYKLATVLQKIADAKTAMTTFGRPPTGGAFLGGIFGKIAGPLAKLVPILGMIGLAITLISTVWSLFNTFGKDDADDKEDRDDHASGQRDKTNDLLEKAQEQELNRQFDFNSRLSMLVQQFAVLSDIQETVGDRTVESIGELAVVMETIDDAKAQRETDARPIGA